MTINYFYFISKQEKFNNFIKFMKFNKVLLLVLTWKDYKTS